MARFQWGTLVFVALLATTAAADDACAASGDGGDNDMYESEGCISLLQNRAHVHVQKQVGKSKDQEVHQASDDKTAKNEGAPGKDCGFYTDCPRDYSLADVNASAAGKVPENMQAKLQQVHDAARSACLSGDHGKILSDGGWCYDDKQATLVPAGNLSEVEYLLPFPHVLADPVLVNVLADVLLREDGSCCHSLNDFGAGVGQFGHALKARLPELEYHGYDAGGNVEEFTRNSVSFVDLTIPFRRKRTDWLLYTEVGEHIPHEYEETEISNIHAHNCRGVVLTWGVLQQNGHGHVNCHSNDYLISMFEGLGYALNPKLTEAVRVSREGIYPRSPWLEHSAMVFERLSKPAECP